MAHKIDNSKGFNSFIGYKESAWHGLGTVLNERIDIKTALEKSGMDYEVKKLPNVHVINSEISIPSEKSFFTYRTDVNKVLGASVGKVYQVVQNEAALAVCDDIMKNNSQIQIDTCGVLDEGRISFITLKMPRPTEIVKGDDYFEYILVVNSFDGTTPIMCLYTNIRVVCWNTCSAAMRGKHKNFSYVIKHTSTAHDRMNEALKVLAKQKEVSKMTLEAFRAMHGTKLTSQQMKDFAFNILLNDTEITSIQQGTGSVNEIVSTRKLNMINGINEFTETGVGQSTIQNTAWGAFNGVTGFFTNVRAYADAQDRFTNLMLPVGTANDHMIKAYDLALSPSLIRPIKPLSTNKSIKFNPN